MAGLSPFAGRISPLVPACIGRGGAGVNPPMAGPATLATAGVDLTDGTGAIVNTTVAASYTAGLSTASVAVAGAGHFLIGFTVTASGAGSVAIFDSTAAAGSTGNIIGIIPSTATATPFQSLGGVKGTTGIVYGGGSSAPVVTLLWS